MSIRVKFPHMALNAEGVPGTHYKMWNTWEVSRSETPDHIIEWTAHVARDDSPTGKLAALVINCHAASWGLILAITATERDLIKRENTDHLLSLTREIEKVQRLLRSPKRSYAGILPSVLLSRGFQNDGSEARISASCISQAIAQMPRLANVRLDDPIIMLGARGLVGSELLKLISDRPVYKIDTRSVGDTSLCIPEEVKGRRAIFVDVSRPGAIEHYIEHFWKDLIVLNEVYPPASKRAVRKMKQMGVRIFHVAGVVGGAFPAFPGSYNGSIPCCAAHDPRLPVNVVQV